MNSIESDYLYGYLKTKEQIAYYKKLREEEETKLIEPEEYEFDINVYNMGKTKKIK